MPIDIHLHHAFDHRQPPRRHPPCRVCAPRKTRQVSTSCQLGPTVKRLPHMVRLSTTAPTFERSRPPFRRIHSLSIDGVWADAS